MSEQQKYIGSILTRTKALITTNYQKLPLKAPKFVENIVVYADSVSQPFIQKVTDTVDDNINRSVQIVQSYEKTFNIAEQGQKLKQKGKELTDQLRENSKKALDQGVDLAKNNGATQFVLNTCDNVANRVFNSIEGNVVRMQKAILKESKATNSEQTYNQRAVQLAYNLTELTQGLFTLLKNEIHTAGGQKVQQLKIFVTLNFKQHLNATLFTYKVIVVQPISSLYTTSMKVLKSQLNTLREKYNNQDLLQYIIEQLTQLKEMIETLKYEEFQTLLFTALKQLNLFTILKSQYQKTIQAYKHSLDEQRQVVVEEEEKEPEQETQETQIKE
ncbi:unnamed protein product (macronuclear) [Paramecium tetraurelia]|uniref:Uncharacterized protein n=1 Tax=Paramecium tetraurelia TaxID=5888 RepID=A0BSY6_PARTE|nr:uncharacterized protein GSPATT00031885001 [Paramecium tetraurelia]CAK61653.1 unnamed protein product [Paramecium tetraurelia]|eukprot:XP_001429051.1 hypothetical protein (macronuclear) [Paramecium tetraurelia strain d4-2]